MIKNTLVVSAGEVTLELTESDALRIKIVSVMNDRIEIIVGQRLNEHGPPDVHIPQPYCREWLREVAE